MFAHRRRFVRSFYIPLLLLMMAITMNCRSKRSSATQHPQEVVHCTPNFYIDWMDEVQREYKIHPTRKLAADIENIKRIYFECTGEMMPSPSP